MPKPAHPRLSAAARPTGIVLAAAICLVIPGCTKDAPPSATSISLRASDDACELSRTDFTAGVNTLNITNGGGKVTEVYVYTADQKIVTERENITPGATVDLTFELKPGSYEIACKPGQTGTGIRTKISVGGTSASAGNAELNAAVTQYRAYVQEQADAGLPVVVEFATAIKANDLAKAPQLYAPSRPNWERVEPVAESFGDLDPKLDLREADLEPGQAWTGWHRLEKAIFSTKSTAGQAKYADQLVADYETFRVKVATAELTPTGMANGAKELLDEVATGKITGEENI
ncbi:MAG: iron uptake system protein EfeO, partial [Angustibacter sp.]